MRFFFYGTLMDAELLSAVIGRAVKASELKPAILQGYRRLSVAVADYPIVIPDKFSTVEGVIIEAIDTAERKRLIAYEGIGYKPVRSSVQLRNRRRVRAYVFVADMREFKTTRRLWSLAGWQRRYKAKMLAWISKQRWVKG